jgi:hypothetical protein
VKIKLKANQFGLLTTEDKKWGIRQIGLKLWSVAKRDDPTDPYGWDIIAYVDTKEMAMSLLFRSLPCEE